MSLPTLDDLRSLLRYDPESGHFFWLVDRPRGSNARRAGDVAGSMTRTGYWRLNVPGAQFAAHRVAFLFMTGAWPERGVDIDHVDGNRTNNRWTNLRLASRSENVQNVIKPRRGCLHGFKGVKQTRGYWTAQLTVDGVRHYLGSFTSGESAHAAYLDAKKRLHPAAARGITVPDNGGIR
jgi:hypothetical protein